jgi:hypothetical protein
LKASDNIIKIAGIKMARGVASAVCTVSIFGPGKTQAYIAIPRLNLAVL